MNIKQAKEYIKDTVTLYLKKDEFGEYSIPVVRQRPVFLLGAPGIGKTAIMEQIAGELGIALVAYSMTHHTRQSALGLPYIVKKTYDGNEVPITEYTMSEIIASVYETMENSGMREGILFLDEINCVSETLAPSMLQFLQYKTFGRHKVPEGWIIVTAGNPPEYNKSVREFDVVTMDRLKVLEVEADYDAWKIYAGEVGMHGSVLGFLELHKDYFYHIETTVQGRLYVTARGWEDLSKILYMYEEEHLTVSEELIGQYIRSEQIVKEFGAYYDLYQKYKKDYRVDEILRGEAPEETVEKAKLAPFDERLSLLGLLIDSVMADIKEIMEQAKELQELMPPLRACKNGGKAMETLDVQIDARQQLIARMDAGGTLTPAEKRKHKRILHFMEKAKKEMVTLGKTSHEEAAAHLESCFNEETVRLKERTKKEQDVLTHLFDFASAAFKNGNEMLILVTELTVNTYAAQFIATFGSDAYKEHSEKMLLGERQDDLMEKIKELKL
ncbi:MAG: AAA family ATPase [Lachnospiraceae bacterium]|nr:AAA family ATPase [Lachnospiraceae bacterium]